MPAPLHTCTAAIACACYVFDPSQMTMVTFTFHSRLFVEFKCHARTDCCNCAEFTTERCSVLLLITCAVPCRPTGRAAALPGPEPCRQGAGAGVRYAPPGRVQRRRRARQAGQRARPCSGSGSYRRRCRHSGAARHEPAQLAAAAASSSDWCGFGAACTSATKPLVRCLGLQPCIIGRVEPAALNNPSYLHGYRATYPE